MEFSTDPTTTPRPDPNYHPAAALFPLLPVDSPEFGELVADIGAHGLLQPIVLHEGMILDGRNRFRACQHASLEPGVSQWGLGALRRRSRLRSYRTTTLRGTWRRLETLPGLDPARTPESP